MPITQHFVCKPWLQVFFDIRIFILFILSLGNFSDAQNHALFRPALHSCIPYNHNVNGAAPHNIVDLHGAERAVDSNVSSYSLSDTGDINQHASWSVILEGYTIVQSVTIVAAEEKYRYVESIVVVVEKSTEEMKICAEFHNASALKPSARLYLNCPTSPIGGRVTIHRAGGYEPWKLALAEVIVEGILISGNQALQKATRQIGTSEEYFSSNAVDRNPYSCSLTDDPENRPAWWQVDLGHVFLVKSVKIAVDGPQHLKVNYKEIMVTVDHTDVTDSNRSCVMFTYDIFKGPISIMHECVMPLEGRYVTISRRGESMQPQTLGLCDVEVIGDYAGLTVGDPIMKADPAIQLAASSFLIYKSSSNSEASNENNEEGSSAMKSGQDTSISCSIFGSVQYFWVALASLTFVVSVLVNRLIIIKYMNRRIISMSDQNTDVAYKKLANSLDSDVQLSKLRYSPG